jgi:hypothetical protein
MMCINLTQNWCFSAQYPMLLQKTLNSEFAYEEGGKGKRNKLL